MDWKILFATFSAVFFAELADKTQLVGIGMSAKSGKPLMVFLGSVAAYCIVTALSVMLGAVVAGHLKPEHIRSIGASLFILIGILMFAGKL